MKRQSRIHKRKRIITLVTFVLMVGGLIVACSTGGAGKPTEPQKVEETTAPPEDLSGLREFDGKTKMLTLGVGEALRYSGGSALSSDNTGVLSVDTETGKLTAAAAGYATLSQTPSGGTATKCFVTVRKAPTAVRFRNGSVNMQKGEKTTLYLIAGSDDEGFSSSDFTSDDSSVLSVSEDGTAEALAAGSAMVTAQCYNGKSAQIQVTVLDNSGFTDKTTTANSDLREDSDWSSKSLGAVPAGSKVRQYGSSADGRWLKVRYGDICGWMYNKAFGEVTNYTEYTLATLPVMADDLLFDIGTDKRAVFDFVYSIAYSNNEDDTNENLCVDYFKTVRGSCYTHAAMLCYLYNRCGYESLRLVGESAYEGAGDHSWCLTKTEDGWRHFDAQFFTIREADEQFGVTDDTYWQWFHWDKTNTPAAV